MSATMDVDLFSEYFNKAPVLYLEGRQHPIQIYYTKQPQSDYLHAALVSIFQIHQVNVALAHHSTSASLFTFSTPYFSTSITIYQVVRVDRAILKKIDVTITGQPV